MKNQLKAAFPAFLAVVLAWIAIEAIKYGRQKYAERESAKRIRAQQQAAAAQEAASTSTNEE